MRPSTKQKRRRNTKQDVRWSLSTIPSYTSSIVYNKHTVPRCIALALTELDDLGVEYKNAVSLSKSDFEVLIAALELVFPRYKGRFSTCRAIVAGRNVRHVPRHTVPCGRSLAALVADSFFSSSHDGLYKK